MELIPFLLCILGCFDHIPSVEYEKENREEPWGKKVDKFPDLPDKLKRARK